MAELQGEDKKQPDEIRIAQIEAEAKEKKRADEIRFAQIEAAKEQAKIEAEKELALKELQLTFIRGCQTQMPVIMTS